MSDKELNSRNEIALIKELFTDALIAGLKAAHELHEGIGDAGRLDFQQNQFGETALTLDIQSEEAIISKLREINIPLKVLSEEHGEFDIGEDPEYIVVLDGLDGSGEYKEHRGSAMYGTMVSILEGNNPKYSDYVICGMMIHSPKPQLFLAIKGGGCFSVDIETGERELLKRKEIQEFSERSIVDLDVYWGPYKILYDNNKGKYPNLQCAFFSSAARCALFLKGEIDIGLEWTRKGNLEQSTSFGLIREFGGVITTADGVGIGDKDFRSFAQTEHIPLIVAHSQEETAQVSQQFNLNRIRGLML